MTIIQLQYIMAVAEYQNFTLAAEKCFVTQPTLSMQIQKLEEELAVVLFDRTKKPIEMTPIGKKIIIQAKNIINESKRITDIIDQEKKYIGGEFRLGIIPTIMPTLLPMFLNHFIKKYPDVKLLIEEQTTGELINKLYNNSIDAAIAGTPLEEEWIQEDVLYYEPFVAYMPNRMPNTPEKITVSDLNNQELLLLQDGHCFKQSILNLCKPKKKAIPHDFQLESGSFETLLKLADEGLGMTLLPYLHTLDIKEKDKKKLVYFTEPAPAREVSLIYPKSHLKKQIIEALKNTISGVVKAAIVYQDVRIISPLSKEKK